MSNVSSMAAARRAAREATARAQEERARRERQNIEDLATVLVARDRLAGVAQWEAEKVAGIAALAARRRDEQRRAAAAAVCRIKARGEAIGAIARLANIGEAEVRAYLKEGKRHDQGSTAPAQPLGAEQDSPALGGGVGGAP